MKKRIFCLLLIAILMVLTVRVKAAQSVLNIPWNIDAATPNYVPQTSTTFYGATTNEFKFNTLEFRKTDGSYLPGLEDMAKIILSKTMNYVGTNPTLTNVMGEKGTDWFTAYCLDGEKKYPSFGIYSTILYGTAVETFNSSTSTAEEKLSAKYKALGYAVAAAILNDEGFKTALADAENYAIGPSLTEGGLVTVNDIYYAFPEGKNIDSYFNENSIILKNENLEVLVKKIEYSTNDFSNPEFLEISASVLASAKGVSTVTVGTDTAISIKFKAEDVLFNKFKVQDKLGKAYNQALWILEHSYPTLTVDETIALVKKEAPTLTRESLLEEIKSLYPANTITGTDAEDDYIEMYLYGIVQYAIWNIYDEEKALSRDLGENVVLIRKTANHSTQLTNLEAIYRFYIKERSEYADYDTQTDIGKIKVTSPQEGKELYKTTDTTYTYGPFSAQFTGVMNDDSNKNLTLTIKNSDKTGIKIVNTAGTEINSIAPNSDFYVEANKNIQAGTIEIGLSVNAKVYWPLQNRGKIFNPIYTLGQNVMSGGRISSQEVTETLNVDINPKTGVEDVAVLLMVTLVAFSLGYLVLSYKGKGSFLK